MHEGRYYTIKLRYFNARRIGGIEMGTASNMTFHHDLYLMNESMIFVTNHREVIFANEKAKLLLELTDNKDGYLLPIDEASLQTWYNFTEQVRHQLKAHCEIQLQTSAQPVVTVHGSYDELHDMVIATLQVTNQSSQMSAEWSALPMFDSIDLGIMMLTEDGFVVDVNQKALQYIGCSKSEVLAKHYKQLIKYFTYDRESAKQFYNKLQRKEKASLLIHKSEDSEPLYYELKVFFDLASQLYIISIFDHTSYMRLQAQLKEERYLKELGQMSASIAHEIRNPLTALKGFMELLKSEAPAEQEHYFTIMESEFQRLDMILSDMLFLSSPRKTAVQKVDLVEIVKEVIDFMQFEALMHEVILQLEFDNQKQHIILGNSVRLKQMLINLLKNSIQATENCGTITVRLHVTAQYVQVYVQDEGIGMDEETCKSLFNPFFTTKEHGTGLGLPLVKKVIDDYNGKIEVQSELNVGTTFILTFPNALTKQSIGQSMNLLLG